MKKYITPAVIVVITSLLLGVPFVAWYTSEPQEELAIGAFNDAFISYQLATTTLTNGNVLQTDGTNSFWVSTSSLGISGGSGGDSISIDGSAVVDPDFTSTGDIDFVDTSNTVTANINNASIVEGDLNANAPTDDFVFTASSTAPGGFIWKAAAGGGNVSNTGTPVDNQLAIWTGATTIEGDSALTFDGSLLTTTDLTASGDLFNLSRLNSPTYGTLQDFFNTVGTPGISATSTSISTTTNAVSVPAVTGHIRALDDELTTLSFFDAVASSSVSVPATTTRHIGIEYNGGTPRYVSNALRSSFDYDTSFPLGVAVNDGTTVYAADRPWTASDPISNLIERIDGLGLIQRDERPEHQGVMIGTTGTRNVTFTTGQLVSRLSEYSISAFDSSGTDTWTSYYRDGSGGWTRVGGVTQFPNSQYDDGDGGLASASLLTYVPHWFYSCVDDTHVMLYGQEDSAALADAAATNQPSTRPDRINELCVLSGRIIAQQGSNTSAQTISYFTEATPAGAAISSHSNLSNLAWTSSGHTGTASRLAGFNGSGGATEIATGTLTTTATGLEFDATRGLVGGASILSLTSGYNIPLTASTTNWNNFFDTPSTRITAGDGIDWSTNTLNVNDVTAPMLASADFGDFTCDGVDCEVDASFLAKNLAWTGTGTTTFAGNLDVAGTIEANVFRAVTQIVSSGDLDMGGNNILNVGTLNSLTLPSSNFVGLTDTQTLINKTLTSPTLGSFFGTPCSGNNFLQDISDTGAFTCTGASGTISTSTALADTQITYATGLDTIGSSANFTFDDATSILSIATSSASGKLTLEGTDILVSSGGTMTLSNVDAIDATTEATFESAIDALSNLTTVGTITSGTWNATIADGLIVEPDLSADNTPGDTDYLQYDSTGTNFIWRTVAQVASDIQASITSLVNLTVATISTTLTIPFGTACDSNADGELCQDTTDDQLVIDGKVLPTEVPIFGFQIASTSAKFASSTVIDLPQQRLGYTVTTIACYVTSGTSKVISLFGESLTCIPNGTEDDGTIASPTVTALATTTAVTIGAESGSVDDVNISIFGTWVRQ